METLISWACNNRLLVLLAVAGIVAAGVIAAVNLPIDAVPDVTNIQVQVITASPTLAANEVERFITYPVEVALTGIPRVTELRSISRYGLSLVTIAFEEDVNLFWARQQVAERLAGVEIPEGMGTPEMGPITTGLGEIYQYLVEYDTATRRDTGPYSITELMELRTVQDWGVRKRLLTTPGVVEVNSFGGHEMQYQVLVDPARLVSYDLTIREVLEAVENASRNAGGAYLEHAGEQYIVRGEGLVQGVEDLREAVITATSEGRPIHVHDVAEVVQGPAVRVGGVTADGRGEVMCGIVMMLKGENSRTVAERIRERVTAIGQSLSSQGYRLVPFYDRTELVKRTIRTVVTNLVEGGALVILVLILLLGNFRGSLLVASVIPLSMLFAFTPMYLLGISGNLMSLGAIDFGLIVDGAVIMVENIVRRLAHRRGGEDEDVPTATIVVDAAREVARPVAFAVAIIIIVLLPLLTLQDIEGKMFRPMALVVAFAMTGALFFALTFVPAVSTAFFRGPVAEKEPWLMRKSRAVYGPLLRWALRRPVPVIVSALLLLAAAGAIFPFLGAEFLPKLDEGVIAIQPVRLPSISLAQALAMNVQAERALMTIPEIKTVVSKAGAAELATDPMGPDISDIFVILREKDEWRPGLTKEELIEQMQAALRNVPGMNYSFSQPIELGVNELISGVRSDIVIKIFGDDVEKLRSLAAEIAGLVGGVQGAEDVRLEQTQGLPQLVVRFNRGALARFGISVAEAAATLETAFGGREAGEVFEGDRRFDVVIRLAADARQDAESVQRLLVHGAAGAHVPIADVAEVRLIEGPAQVSREWGSRRLGVEFNVRGRDISSVVDEARAKIARSVALPAGYHLEWGGTFENLERARTRLAIVVPLALALIFLFLFMMFRSVKQALLIYLSLPFAAVGGVFALYLRGMPFSVTAGVGFIALSGVAVLNGIMIVSHINRFRREGMGVESAVIEGAEVRLRAVLMTALVAALGFMPMALSTGAGAEVQRPLATVVIGGLLLSTPLMMLLLPILYRWFEREREVEF